MAFNETTLNDTIIQLHDRITKINTERNNIQSLLDSLESIQDETVIGRDETGKSTSTKRKKIDMGTGVQFTTIRRNDIYNACIPKANTKLQEKI